MKVVNVGRARVHDQFQGLPLLVASLAAARKRSQGLTQFGHMNLLKTLVLSATLSTVGLSGWAINKCTIEGKVVFQDQACANGQGGKIDVRPASGPSASTQYFLNLLF